ncbi:LytR C-terminal domain-containing protein [Frankia sp. Cr1]|uniref:LytR C-terminal domain-containing protein n=1 Tax=Frankia sp. Cr1 TaxID=3073931 RepID=UPI002AD37E53|nr:LytR C-terminal domain-containing protein [Frankia sp. Cr1]
MTDTTVTSPSPPRPPRLRPGDRLHAIAAGSIAVLAVLGCILVVNLVNDPSADKSAATAAAAAAAASASAHAPAAGASPTAAASAAAAAARPATSHPSAAVTSPSPRVTSQPPAAAAPAPAAAPKHVFIPIVILNNSKIPGLADSARARLEAAGFTVARTGNYQSAYDVPEPTVFYDEGHQDAAQTVLDLIPDVKQAKPKTKSFVADEPLILVVTKAFSPTAP